jgi:type IV secretory system conjugative DNA transfer VirD4/TraG family protein
MSRREWAASIGASSAVIAAHWVWAWLAADPLWVALTTAEPRTGRYLTAVVLVPLPLVGAILACAFVNFAEVHGFASVPRRRARPLRPYPFDPTKTQLVIGETHEQDGTRSDQPAWLVLPEKGMYTGVLITGATGSAKTSAAQYPFTAQLIHLHADDPARKMGGLIIDAKGNYADFVRDQCARAGRLSDYYEVSLTSGVRWNIIGRPDLNAAALGGHIADMIENVQGTSLADPFWHQEAKDLASQVIRVLRLAEGREPTMASLYRAATSYEAFEQYVQLAEKRVRTSEQADELGSIKFWLEAKAAKLDAKLRASIAAGLNGVCSLFDDPTIREVFAPEPIFENFRGFDRLIEEGQIVALRVPKSQLKTVSTIVGTMTKLNFFDAVLNRLARAEHGAADVTRGVFFVADEYDGYTTQPGDGEFFSKCREALCCAVIATQTYESFVAKLKNEHVAAQLIANLRTKIWLCAEDNYTARQAADLCGEIERRKVSRTRNETARRSAYSFLDGDVIGADSGAVGEGITVSLRREHLFTPRAFTSLKVNQAIVKAFDGVRVLEPWVVYLKPMHESPEVSWFETTGKTVPVFAPGVEGG